MSSTLIAVTTFINLEADTLDFQDYRQWLDLWAEDGLYVVPVDPESEDYANSLNFAYDLAPMRKMRVERLLSDEAISTQTTSKTVRSVSRLRILSQECGMVRVRSAQFIAENRHGNITTYPADVIYLLRAQEETFKIVEKVVRLLNATHHLQSIGYIL